MRVGLTRDGLRITDADGVRCRVGADAWRPVEGAVDFARDVETAVAGRTDELRFPPAAVTVLEPRGDGGQLLGSTADRSDAPDRTLLRLEATVEFLVRIDGSATVADGPRGVAVRLPSPGRVDIGVREPVVDTADGTLTVPKRPDGLASALTALGSCHETTGPARSDPTRRQHPPPIEPGEDLQVPPRIERRSRASDVVLAVPPDLRMCLVLAPLAYYLGARVDIEDRVAPVLRAPALDSAHGLPALPRLQAEAASLLYRTVTLDSLVRAEEATEPAPAGDYLGALGLDAADLAASSVDARLARYLAAPFERVESSLPDWPLSMYVRPTPSQFGALSTVLDQLAFVYLPEATDLAVEERLQRSLEDFYRSGTDAPTVEPLLPDLHRGRLHGWAADGVPIDAFTYRPAAYEHRLETPTPSSEARRLTVVVNDDEMAEEVCTLERRYDGAHAGPDVDLAVHRNLDREALAAVLERPTSVFHYVGHCDEAGLRCADGHLGLADLGEVGARTFFLNACGSYHEGTALVDNGSIAGAVTLRPVLDDQATQVGTAFLGLLLAGFTVERALRVACRRAIMNKDYVVVGDGSYALCGRSEPVDLARITERGDRYAVAVEYGVTPPVGTPVEATFGADPRLAGGEEHAELSRPALLQFLEDREGPVVFRNRFYWASDLASELRDGTTER